MTKSARREDFHQTVLPRRLSQKFLLITSINRSELEQMAELCWKDRPCLKKKKIFKSICCFFFFFSLGDREEQMVQTKK